MTVFVSALSDVHTAVKFLARGEMEVQNARTGHVRADC
jgi:hypothetical protein